MKLKKSVLIVCLTIFFGISFSPLFLSKASALDTEANLVDAWLYGIESQLYSYCSLSQADRNRKADEFKEKYGFAKQDTAAYDAIAGCSNADVSGAQQITESQRFLEHTTIGNVVNLSVSLYNEKPSSGILWFQDQYYAITGQGEVFARIDQPPESNKTPFYTPGPGFSLLSPLQGLWTWSRNLAYLAFIVLIIVVGFLILFRNRLDGQTPITIFNSIPTMILSLVLITFSYPISALFVDVITIGTGLVQNVLISAPGAPGYDYLWGGTDGDVNTTGWDVDIPLTPDLPGTAVDESQQATPFMLQPDDPQISVWQVFNTAGAQLCPDDDDTCSVAGLLPDDIGQGNAIGQFVEFIVGTADDLQISSALVRIVIGFAVFTASIKLFLTLLNKYIVLTMGVILAPWYFFIAALPSKTQTTLVDFLKIHLGAAFTFIAVYGVFLFLIVFVQAPTTANLEWVPPLLGYTDTQVIQGNLIAGVISFGIFLATPSIPELIDSLFEIPTGNQIAQSVGERLGTAGGQVAGYGRTVAASFLPNVPGVGGR